MPEMRLRHQEGRQRDEASRKEEKQQGRRRAGERPSSHAHHGYGMSQVQQPQGLLLAAANTVRRRAPDTVLPLHKVQAYVERI